MWDDSGRTMWGVAAAISVAFSLATLIPANSAPTPAGCCIDASGCSVTRAPSCNGSFSSGQVCSGGMNSTCVDPVLGCCETGRAECAGEPCFELSLCSDNVSELDCLLGGGEFSENAECSDVENATINSPEGSFGRCVPIEVPETATATPSSTPTVTPTSTATATSTPTNTKIPDGVSCVDPLDCASGNCVDDVCCESACDGPGQSCNLAGLEGACLGPETMAPVASNRILPLLVAVLAALGVVTVARRRDLGNSVRSLFHL